MTLPDSSQTGALPTGPRWFKSSLLAGILLLFALIPVGAQETAFQRALLQIQLKRYVAAAEIWEQVGHEQADQAELEVQLKGGLSLVAATVAYQQVNDDRAYATWSRAIELFLRSGSDWPSERTKLAGQLKEFENLAASASNSDTGGPSLDSSDLALLTLDSLLGLSRFEGPRRGLTRRPNAGDNETISEARGYVARPLALANIGEANSKKPATEKRPGKAQLARTLIVVEEDPQHPRQRSPALAINRDNKPKRPTESPGASQTRIGRTFVATEQSSQDQPDQQSAPIPKPRPPGLVLAREDQDSDTVDTIPTRVLLRGSVSISRPRNQEPFIRSTTDASPRRPSPYQFKLRKSLDLDVQSEAGSKNSIPPKKQSTN